MIDREFGRTCWCALFKSMALVVPLIGSSMPALAEDAPYSELCLVREQRNDTPLRNHGDAVSVEGLERLCCTNRLLGFTV